MARALLGYVGNPAESVLALEVVRLRRRVTELEAELADLRAADHAASSVLELELHQIAAEGAPALA
jgi:hypothetical protein